MKKHKFISKNEFDTKSFAKKFATMLNQNAVIVLTGELGSGKTKFVEGFLEYFGLENEISSPTFNIVNEYKKDDINIYHFDVYRLEDSSEFFEIGGEEYFSSGICLIEWGEIIKDALPKDYIHIIFEKDDNDENIRVLNISAYGNYNLKDIGTNRNANKYIVYCRNLERYSLDLQIKED